MDMADSKRETQDDSAEVKHGSTGAQLRLKVTRSHQAGVNELCATCKCDCKQSKLVYVAYCSLYQKRDASQ